MTTVTRLRKTNVDITGEIHSMIPTETYRKQYDMIDWSEQSGGRQSVGDIINQPENGNGTTDNT